MTQSTYLYEIYGKNLIAGFLSTPVLAFAESTQFFIGAEGGDQWTQNDSYHHSESSGAIWGIYSGVQLPPSWSWDVGYR